MYYVVETKLPDYDDWYPVIDVEKSKLHPQVLKFDTKEAAESWASKHAVKNHDWKVVEYESE